MNLPTLYHRPPMYLALLLALLVAFSWLRPSRTRATGFPVTQSSPVTPTALSKPELVRQYQEMITPAKLAARLYFLASDLFEGRETTTRGQKLAAQYLASQYRLMGGLQEAKEPHHVRLDSPHNDLHGYAVRSLSSLPDVIFTSPGSVLRYSNVNLPNDLAPW